ncbi:MAG TPA: hypothetical protein PLX97_03735 [Gemmatales bacterium]|nr:hypothetical protein [Gemmatales bacterium]
MIEHYRPVQKLRFAPLAWLKWQFLCHAGPTEVAGFGLSSAHDPLFVEDILVVGQRATAVTVQFDDSAIADLFDRMTDQGIAPHRFARIWLHSHPGASATPSGVDEATFTRVFGACDWSVMAILSRTSATYARLQFNAGPGGSVELPVVSDWQAWPRHLVTSVLDSHVMRWKQEYEQSVKPMQFPYPELLPEEPTEVLNETINLDLLTWGELLEYANP